MEIGTRDNYGSSYRNGKVSLTLVKTATYCAHPQENRPLLREGIFIPKIDQGQRDFAFRLDVTDEASLKRIADAFTETSYALNVFPTVDEKTDNGFTLSKQNGNISFITLKKAVQTDGYLMRLQNCAESPAEDTVTFGDCSLTLHFDRYEVKTVVYRDGTLTEIREMLI